MHVEQWTDRHGTQRVYFRRGKGKRIPLPSNVQSPEFEAAYAAALAGTIKARSPLDRAAPDTIGGLVTSYLRSPDFVDNLKPSTKIGYMIRLDKMRREHGWRSVSDMDRVGIETYILNPLAGQPGARLDTLKKLRILIKHANSIGWLKHDPTIGIKRPKTTRIRSWTEDEITAYEARWPVGSKQRTAFALFLYSAQRVSDVHRMTWADTTATTIRVTQMKTGKPLLIPLHYELRGILDATKREHVTIINTAFGKPFSRKGFGNWMRDAITDAGLPLDAQPHGLRKAAGRRLAEAGCTAKEIMAVLGHDTLAEAERYTSEADQAGLARAAIVKLEGQRGNGMPKPMPERLGFVENSVEKSMRKV